MELMSFLSELYTKIEHIKKNDVLISQRVYGLDDVPNINTIGLVGEIHSVASKRSCLHVDKAELAKIKKRTIEEIEGTEKEITDVIAGILGLPDYIRVRFGWKGASLITLLAEPILDLDKMNTFLQDTTKEVGSASYDSIKTMGVPDGTTIKGVVEENKVPEIKHKNIVP